MTEADTSHNKIRAKVRGECYDRLQWVSQKADDRNSDPSSQTLLPQGEKGTLSRDFNYE
jgi:hypothetical protein